MKPEVLCLLIYFRRSDWKLVTIRKGIFTEDGVLFTFQTFETIVGIKVE